MCPYSKGQAARGQKCDARYSKVVLGRRLGVVGTGLGGWPSSARQLAGSASRAPAVGRWVEGRGNSVEVPSIAFGIGSAEDFSKFGSKQLDNGQAKVFDKSF